MRGGFQPSDAFDRHNWEAQCRPGVGARFRKLWRRAQCRPSPSIGSLSGVNPAGASPSGVIVITGVPPPRGKGDGLHGSDQDTGPMFRRRPTRLSSTALLALAATVALAVLVALATLTPLPRAVSVGGGDKLHHVIAFAALALPVSLLRPKVLPVAMLLLAAYGGAIELIQPLVGRSCELADWLADLAGILLGSTLGFAVNRIALLVLRSRAALREVA